MAASRASSAAPTLPSAVTNAGLKLEASVRSNVLSKVPDVTPKGNSAKVGVVVATRRLPLGGCTEGTQQWICEAVVPEVSPLNVTSTCNVCAAGSKTAVAKPVPVVAVGGISAAPVRLAPKVIGVANATDDPANATAVAKTNAESSNLISPSQKSKSQRSRVLALRKPVVRA